MMFEILRTMITSLARLRQIIFVVLPQRVSSNTFDALWETLLIIQSGFRTNRLFYKKKSETQVFNTLSLSVEDFQESDADLFRFSLVLQNLCNKAEKENLDGVTVYFHNSKHSELSIKLFAIVLLMPVPVDFKNFLQKDTKHFNKSKKFNLIQFKEEAGIKLKKYHQNNAREWIKNLGLEYKFIVVNMCENLLSERVLFEKFLETFLSENRKFKILNIGQHIDLPNQFYHHVVNLGSQGLDYLEVLAICSEADFYVGTVAPEFGVAQYYNLHCLAFGDLPRGFKLSSRTTNLKFGVKSADFASFFNSAY